MSPPHRALFGIAVTFTLVGVVEPHLPHAGEFLSEISVVQTFITMILLFTWCKADAAARGLTPPTGAPLLVALIAVVGVPYYLFRTRAAKAAWVDLAKAIGFFALITAAYGVCFYVSARVP